MRTNFLQLITRLHHAQITIPKGAEDQCRKFYCDLLGLREVVKPEALRGRGGCWLEVGDAQVHVGAEDAANRAQTKAHVAYEVDDLASVQSKLEQHGFEILDGIPIPGYKRFETRDPFGNRVEFIQRINSRKL